jgi:hypothetical protein
MIVFGCKTGLGIRDLQCNPKRGRRLITRISWTRQYSRSRYACSIESPALTVPNLEVLLVMHACLFFSILVCIAHLISSTNLVYHSPPNTMIFSMFVLQYMPIALQCIDTILSCSNGDASSLLICFFQTKVTKPRSTHFTPSRPRFYFPQPHPHHSRALQRIA